jgi:hypothetical protein
MICSACCFFLTEHLLAHLRAIQGARPPVGDGSHVHGSPQRGLGCDKRRKLVLRHQRFQSWVADAGRMGVLPAAAVFHGKKQGLKHGFLWVGFAPLTFLLTTVTVLLLSRLPGLPWHETEWDGTRQRSQPASGPSLQNFLSLCIAPHHGILPSLLLRPHGA